MNTDDLENFEAERELQLAQEYQDVVSMFRYAVETDRRFYLANNVDVKVLSEGPRPIVEVNLSDAWVWDMYRKSRFVPKVRVLSFKDLNIEELPPKEIETVELLRGETRAAGGQKIVLLAGMHNTATPLLRATFVASAATLMWC